MSDYWVPVIKLHALYIFYDFSYISLDDLNGRKNNFIIYFLN